jgi:hypothetical protein
MDKFIKMYGCMWYNIADIGEMPQLILIDVPSDVDTVDVSSNDAIIGINVDTVNLDNVKWLRVPGRIFGDKHECGCKEVAGFVEYSSTEHADFFNFAKYVHKSQRYNSGVNIVMS